jgi:hypothetical protein
MSAFPNFSNIAGYVKDELNSRKENVLKISGLNAWVRIASGVNPGLILTSNPNYQLFAAAGVASIYGDSTNSGVIGTSWKGAPVYAGGETQGFRPKPNITSIEIDEGAGTLSRKASFSITAYTKAQLDALCKYFLEPGYTIFIEWGWNTPNAMIGFAPSLNASYIADFQSFKNVNEMREKAKGQRDNYLGFITGGSISMNGDQWTLNVKCTGFTELPAYLLAADNSEQADDSETSPDASQKAEEFDPSDIDGESDLGRKRFMMAFNLFPSNRRTLRVMNSLDSSTTLSNPVNFINVDESVKAEINSKVGGTTIAGVSINDEEAEVDGKTVEFPSGTKIIGDEAYIRFSALMEVFNTIGANGYKMANGKILKLAINTTNTVCSAFPQIFSTDKSKLYIPNNKLPKFSIAAAAGAETDENVFAKALAESEDCSVIHPTDAAQIIKFPQDTESITNGVALGRTIAYKGPDMIGLSKPAGQWGFLNDLYVNLSFAKGIMETKNFSIKDALYQILNGMSGAAGGMWDFQIMEGNEVDGGITELLVVDMNMSPINSAEKITQFDVVGSTSIFMDANLSMDIGGAKMNQIIGNRLGQSMNSSQPDIKGKKKGLFTDENDLVLTAIERNTPPPTTKPQTKKEKTQSEKDDAAKEARAKNLQVFLSKIGLVPVIKYTEDGPFDEEIQELTNVVSFNDQTFFESLKNGNTKKFDRNAGSTSILMPIKFSFTIHGVSGIKRGDKFRVNGIPSAYEKTGFFQVTSVKHIIDGMIWKTEIEGGFRLSKK